MVDFSQRVIWTALPTGIEDDYVTLTALVSPRLTINGLPMAPLGNWSDFLNWPQRILDAQFYVSFPSASSTTEAKRISEPDPTVWAALFGTNTGVFNHAFKDRRSTGILSYPMAEVHDFITDTYRDLAFDAQDDLPDKRDIFSKIDLLAREKEQDDFTFQKESLSRLRVGIQMREECFSGTVGAFSLQELYHMPMAAQENPHYYNNEDPRSNARWRQHRFYELPDKKDLASLIDFHQIVSALNQYPKLLRLTGLAVDLRLPKQHFGTNPVTGSLNLKVFWHPTDSNVHTYPDVYPLTQTKWNISRLSIVKAKSSTPISNGMLVLNDQKRFRIMQMDVDGAGIKLRNTSRSFLRSRKPASDKSTDPAGVANIRTVGLQLVEVDRHLSLSESFNNSGKMQDALEGSDPNEKPDPIELFAEDLVRGYYADILDETKGNGWQSLCRRDGHYEFLNTGTSINTEDEEGMIRLAAQEAIDETDSDFQDIIKISEQVFSWSGWSLTAPRKGLAIDKKDEVNSSQNTAPPDIPLETNFNVRRGSLPSLRFGHAYRMRVRIADLAGNAIEGKPGDHHIPSEASSSQIFKRYEPVPVPVNALVNTVSGLEKPADGEAMSRPAIRSFNDKESDNSVKTSEEMRRHIVPPRTSHVMAELHGALDNFTGQPNPALYSLLAQKDGDLTEIKVLQEDTLTDSSDLVPYSTATESFELPYLPDVLAKTAVVRLHFDPQTEPAKRFEIPYYEQGTKWPDARPFKLRIFESPSATIKFDRSSRTLNIPLAKADVMQVRISHSLTEKDLELLALWDIVKSHPEMNEDTKEKLRKHILSGAHWMFTPWLEMELVHAVQRPLVKPAFLKLSINRPFGETAAHVRFRSPIHAKSTDKTELMGRWREPSDIPAEGAPRVVNLSSSAFETRLRRDSAPTEIMDGSGHHVFEDTRFRRVRYKLEATTRYKEFMPSSIRQVPSKMTVESDYKDAFVENSAIPSAPEVTEVVPTFGWARWKTTKSVSSFRSGGGLRVWLKRPWFTTGFGEMLGVTVAATGTPNEDLTDKLAKYVTQWGVDPIWRSGSIATPSPPVSVFSKRIMGGPIPADRSPEFVPNEERNLPSPFARVTNLVLPESNGTLVDVVPHGVNFDPKKDSYYTDIIVKPGSSYFPFIRLALTRFHPVSSQGAHLSPVVMSDWMQLSPDRLLIMSEGEQSNQRKLQLFGYSYTRSSHHEEIIQQSHGPIINAELQVRKNKNEGELGWKKFTQLIPLPFNPLIEILDPANAPILTNEADNLISHASLSIRPNLEVFIALKPPLMWEQTITLPRRKAGEELRIMVTEYEKHVVDTDRSDLPDDAIDPTLRLVYAETLYI